MSKLAHPFAAILLVSSMFLSVPLAAAENASFTVQPQQEHVITLYLITADNIRGSFSVISKDDAGMNMYVTNPQGNTVLTYNNSLGGSFTFNAESTGDYQLHFNNSLSLADRKMVALNYNITRYILGIPQEQFLLLVAAVFGSIGMIVFVKLLPK